MMMEAKIDQDVIPQLAQQKTVDQPAQLGIQFLPEVGPDISWTGGEMSIRYEMCIRDRLYPQRHPQPDQQCGGSRLLRVGTGCQRSTGACPGGH